MHACLIYAIANLQSYRGGSEGSIGREKVWSSVSASKRAALVGGSETNPVQNCSGVLLLPEWQCPSAPGFFTSPPPLPPQTAMQPSREQGCVLELNVPYRVLQWLCGDHAFSVAAPHLWSNLPYVHDESGLHLWLTVLSPYWRHIYFHSTCSYITLFCPMSTVLDWRNTNLMIDWLINIRPWLYE